jgi:16S rRNA (cytosine967-C5)-methyltransferase
LYLFEEQTMAKLARQTAVEALLQINEDGGYSNVVFHNLVTRNELSPQDTALCSVLVYGALERRLTLDHIIGAYSKTPVRKLTPAVREILRISLYQLLYLEHIPDSAAVNEAVKLTRLMKAASASGFVNGVLRSFLRDGKKIPPVKKGGLAQQWQVDYSCPAELIERLLKSCDKEQVKSLLEHSLGRPTLFARVNTTKITGEECKKDPPLLRDGSSCRNQYREKSKTVKQCGGRPQAAVRRIRRGFRCSQPDRRRGSG